MAEVEIDSLSIGIESNTKAAENSLDALISKLKELKAACDMGEVTAGVQAGFEGVEEVAQEAQEAAESMEDLGKGAQLGAAGLAILGSGAVLAVNGLVKVKESIERVTNLIGKMVIMKAFRASMKVIKQGFHEGLQNLYRYSAAMNSMDAANTKNSLDQISTSLLYLKNSIGAAVAPLIQAFVPVLQKIVSWAVQAANAINQFVSALQGKTTYTRAKESATTYLDDIGKSAGKANKAAKQLQATLFGFDEINRMDSTNSGGGAGGIGGTAGVKNYLDQFEEAAIDTKFLDTIKTKMKEILQIAIGVGSAIAGWKLGSALSKIMGLDLGSTLKFASGLAVALAGAASEVMGLVSVLEDGVSVSNVLMSILGGLAVVAGSALMGSVFGLAGAFASVAAAIAGIPMYVVGIIDAIEEGLNGLNGLLIGAGATLGGAGVGGIIGLLVGSLGGPEGAAAGAAIGATIGLITDGIIYLTQNFNDLLDVLGPSGLGAVIGAGAGGIIGLFGGPGVAVALAAIGAAIGAIVGSVADLGSKAKEVGSSVVNVWNNIKTAATNVWNSIKTTASTVWAWIKENVITPLQKAFAPIKLVAVQVWTDIKTGAVNAFNTLKAGVQPIFTWFSNTFQTIKKTAGEVWNNMKVLATGAFAVVKEAARQAWVWTQTNIITPAKNAIATVWNALKNKAVEVWNSVKSKAAEAWNAIKSAFAPMANWFASKFSDAWSQVKKVFSTGGQVFTSITTAISSVFKKIVNSLIDGINKVVATPFRAINTALLTLRDTTILGFRPFSSLKTLSIPVIPHLAEGGFVDTVGQLFVANEQGPELVGTVNGRTAVASNQEITGISDAVYGTGEVEARLLREQNELLRQLLQKDTRAVITTDSIVSGLARKNRRDGFSTVPVSV